MVATGSATHEEITVPLSTGDINVLRGGSGPPLVVLHHDIGTPGWLPFYSLLAERATVLVPEAPGFGRSARLEWARHPRDLAAVLQQLLDRLDLDAITLVGLGFGGWLAAEMAVVNQRRLSRLVLVGAAGVRPPDTEITDQFVIAAGDYVRRGFHDQSAFEALFAETPSPEQELAWDIHRETIARITWKPYMVSYQLPALLTGVVTPTLLVWGRHDQIVPLSAGQRYAGLMPNARLEIVEDAGHFVEMERPEELAALIARHVQ